MSVLHSESASATFKTRTAKKQKKPNISQLDLRYNKGINKRGRIEQNI
jgi:hypothetical protein